jgi:hypothetical protein
MIGNYNQGPPRFLYSYITEYAGQITTINIMAPNKHSAMLAFMLAWGKRKFPHKCFSNYDSQNRANLSVEFKTMQNIFYNREVFLNRHWPTIETWLRENKEQLHQLFPVEWCHLDQMSFEDGSIVF